MTTKPPRPGKFAEEDQAIADLREQLKQRFPMPEPKPRRKAGTVTRAGLLSLALLAGVLWLDPAYRSEHYLTQVGQRQAVQLADGSTILLDGASELEVSWHLRSRQTRLVQGQALFEVAPMLYRPFLVEAGSASVRVVGTRFNVDRQQDGVRVSVAEGRVAVRAGGASSLLEPGQQIRVQDGRLGTLAKVEGGVVGAWKDGQLLFERTPLREVLGVIQRYHDKPLRLVDPALGSLPVSGVFDSARVDRLLSLLPGILPVTVSTAADGTVLVAPRGKK
ncbi:MAG: FecR domain-containing protein [Paucimonas sp.]|jgi:transmembrane sensor|nr:FecR domain-containing protein [Paucimonas sp.]